MDITEYIKNDHEKIKEKLCIDGSHGCYRDHGICRRTSDGKPCGLEHLECDPEALPGSLIHRCRSHTKEYAIPILK